MIAMVQGVVWRSVYASRARLWRKIKPDLVIRGRWGCRIRAIWVAYTFVAGARMVALIRIKYRAVWYRAVWYWMVWMLV